MAETLQGGSWRFRMVQNVQKWLEMSETVQGGSWRFRMVQNVQKWLEMSEICLVDLVGYETDKM